MGLALIYAEFFFPGGILAILGAIALGISALGAADSLHADWRFLFFALAGVASVWMTVKLALWHLSWNQQGRVLLNTTQEGYTGAFFDRTLIGSLAVASSDLRPVGYIWVSQQRLVATAQGEFIAKGEKVKIIGGEGSCLTVIKQESGR